jgi:hypothetical protein
MPFLNILVNSVTHCVVNSLIHVVLRGLFASFALLVFSVVFSPFQCSLL